MQLNALLSLIVLHEAFSFKKMMKPSFVPYCTTRDKCLSECSCEVLPQCEILTMDNGTRESILFYHNQIRDIQSKAEPQPGGMAMLKYDEELEEVSKCWAARCGDEYSECFMTPMYPETSMSVTQIQLDVGEAPVNILWIKVMNFWLGNTKYLSDETLSSLPAGEKGENLRNYAQIMSDRVLSVGCAWSKSDVFLTCVCSYGPRGPLQGEPIYKSGTPCSLCPFNYVCDYKKPFENLCKEVEQTPSLPPETPPFLPPTPPQKNYEIMRSQFYPSQSMYGRSEPNEIEYEPQLRSPDVELISEYQPQQPFRSPQRSDSRPPLYFIEGTPPPMPSQKFPDGQSYPPHLPPAPSQYPGFYTPPIPSNPWYIGQDKLSQIITTTVISPHILPDVPDPPKVPMNPLPPNVPLRRTEEEIKRTTEMTDKRTISHHRRSCSGRISVANLMIYISLLIYFFDT